LIIRRYTVSNLISIKDPFRRDKMKIVIVLLALTMLLTGCGAQETFETVQDMMPVEPVASPQQFFVNLPENAATPTFQDGDREQLYVCQDYCITKQILDGGDLQKTLMHVTGKTREELELLKTKGVAWDRYDFVWTSAGEEGLQLGRACILDDGDFHYVLSVMAQEESAGKLRQTITDVMDSCTLLDPTIDLSTGS
jgi:hypothetical protein